MTVEFLTAESAENAEKPNNLCALPMPAAGSGGPQGAASSAVDVALNRAIIVARLPPQPKA
jgi:hypothetical protein